MTSGTVRSKRKMLGEKVSVKFSNKLFQMENKLNLAEQPRPNRKPLFKRANTINKMNNIFHFKGSEIKFKDNQLIILLIVSIVICFNYIQIY